MLRSVIESLRTLLLISLCIGARTTILRLPCCTVAEFMVFEIGKRLTGHVIRTDYGLDDVKCMIKCVEHPKCRSYNINLQDNLCELNSKAHADNGTILITESNWLYKSTDYQNLLIGHTCKEFKPCSSGVLCQDICEPPYYKCLICDENHTGLHCDQKIDRNECENNPCINSGTCIDMFAEYRCNCTDGFTGKNCEIDINECSSLPCFNGGTCGDNVNGFQCSCAPGYNGTLCQLDINECLSQPCLNGGTCSDKLNRFECSCMPGYVGARCETDINECSSNPCPEELTCVDQVNKYECRQNVAVGKIASQSSTLFNGHPWRAIDGNKDTNFKNGSCSFAGKEVGKQTWWKVDLSIIHVIDAVRITNRADCCSERLTNFNIKIDGQLCKHFEGAAGIGETFIRCEKPIDGQILKIQLVPTNEHLNLCEVEVFGRAKDVHDCNTYPCKPGSSCNAGGYEIVCAANVAIGKTTSQSSLFETGVSSKAVDGIKSNSYSDGSCTHTDQSLNGAVPQWWQVDLGANYIIHSINITNRGDGVSERLSNFKIRVDNKLCKYFRGAAIAGLNYIPCTTIIVGRIVKIQLTDANPLTLCEVEVNAIFKVAKAQNSSQSSTYLGGVSSRAIDGVKDGDWHKGLSCTCTANGNRREWWQADLGVLVMVTAVSVMYRIDCCVYGLSNFEITLDGAICKHFNGVAKMGDNYIPCMEMITGQIVKIEFLEKYKHLILCEVQVVAALEVP